MRGNLFELGKCLRWARLARGDGGRTLVWATAAVPVCHSMSSERKLLWISQNVYVLHDHPLHLQFQVFASNKPSILAKPLLSNSHLHNLAPVTYWDGGCS
jgi:hypothetical protein